MSHANAALTPRTRLRLARLVVDRGWTYAAAAKMFMVAPRTAKKWADRYRAEGPAGMVDRSSRPHTSPTKTSPEVVRRIVRLRWRHRLGPGPDRRPARDAGLDRARRAGAVPDQPALPHRPRHRRTAAPLRARPPRLADPRRRHQVRQHPRRRRALVRYVGSSRASATAKPPRAHRRTRQALPARDRHRVRAHRHRRPLPRGLRRDLHRREGRHRDRRPATRRGLVRRPRRHRRASPVRQRLRPTGPTPGATPAPTSASPTSGPGPTGPRPTARSSASTAPWPTAGPTPASTTQPSSATPPCRAGCTSTITTAPTPPSEAKPPVTRLTNLPGHHS